MTTAQFRLFCIVFCKKYNGKTFGEVLPNFQRNLKDDIISYKIYNFDNYSCKIKGANIGWLYFHYSPSFGLSYPSENVTWVDWALVPEEILKYDDVV